MGFLLCPANTGHLPGMVVSELYDYFLSKGFEAKYFDLFDMHRVGAP